jgi:hypothetical protein
MGSEKQILETLSPQIRRRLSNISLSQEITNIIDYEIGYPCNISPASEFVSEVCDMLVQNIMYWLEDEYKFELTSKDKDTLYNYFVDTFGDNIYQRYSKMCLKGKLTESKKEYVISQDKLYNFIYNYINSHYDLDNIDIMTHYGDEEFEGLIDLLECRRLLFWGEYSLLLSCKYFVLIESLHHRMHEWQYYLVRSQPIP